MKHRKNTINLDEYFESAKPLTPKIFSKEDRQPLELDPEYVAAFTKTKFLEDVLVAMEARGMSQAELAQKLGKSRQYVNRVLREEVNFTIETLAQIATAVGMTFTLTVHGVGERVSVSRRPEKSSKRAAQ